jgi:hypothetical protein
MADFAQRLEWCIIFSKVDLRKGYHQIHMHAADILKTAIITPFGLWQLLRMRFGQRNAGNTFQLGCALTFTSEVKFEIEAKISLRLEAKKKPDFT